MLHSPNWHPNKTELRTFGAVLILGFGCIGLLISWKGNNPLAQRMWSISAAVGLLAILFPGLAKPFYWIWMGLGYVVGSIMSRIVLAIIFFGILTPLATVFRLAKRDVLRLKKKPQESYWEDHPMLNKKTFDHLF